jgi:hypothetical protein
VLPNTTITLPARRPDYSLANDCRDATANDEKKREKTPLDGAYTHEASGDWAPQWPNRMIGKILFRRPNGDYASCSGSLLQRRLVVTAGHCAYKNGKYMTDFAFIPSFEYVFAFFLFHFLAFCSLWLRI